MSLRFFARAKANDRDAEHTHDGDAVGGEGPLVDPWLLLEKRGVRLDCRPCHHVVLGKDPCREIAIGLVDKPGVGRPVVAVQRYLSLSCLDGGKVSDLLEGKFAVLTHGQPAVDRDGTAVGNRTARW